MKIRDCSCHILYVLNTECWLLIGVYVNIVINQEVIRNKIHGETRWNHIMHNQTWHYQDDPQDILAKHYWKITEGLNDYTMHKGVLYKH